MAKKIALRIYFDEKTGEVEEVDCTKRFENEGPLFRIDVLRDSIIALEHIYEYEKEMFFEELGQSSNKKIAEA